MYKAFLCPIDELSIPDLTRSWILSATKTLKTKDG